MIRSAILILTLLIGTRNATGGVILQEAYAQSGTYENGRFIIGLTAYETDDAPLVQGVSSVDFSSLVNKSTTRFTYRNYGTVATFELNWEFDINGEIHTEGYGYAYGTFYVSTDTHFQVEHSVLSTGAAEWLRAIEIWEPQSGDLYYFAKGRDPYLGSPTYGDAVDVEEGLSSGTLVGGKSYSIITLFDLHAFADVGSSKGSGNLLFTMRDASVAAVPEPTSLWLWSFLGLLGCLRPRGVRNLTTDQIGRH